MCCIHNLKGHKNILCACLKMFLGMRKNWCQIVCYVNVVDSKIIIFPLYCTLAFKPYIKQDINSWVEGGGGWVAKKMVNRERFWPLCGNETWYMGREFWEKPKVCSIGVKIIPLHLSNSSLAFHFIQISCTKIHIFAFISCQAIFTALPPHL